MADPEVGERLSNNPGNIPVEKKQTVLTNTEKIPYIDNANEVANDKTKEPLVLDPEVKYFAVGPKPRIITCPFCNQRAMTDIRNCGKCSESAFLCLCPCRVMMRAINAIIPCVNVRRHYCSACNAYLGVYNRQFAHE